MKRRSGSSCNVCSSLLPRVEKEEQSPSSESWDVDEGLISKLKEQYKKERKGKKGVKSKSDRTLARPLSLSLIPVFILLVVDRCRLFNDWYLERRTARENDDISEPHKHLHSVSGDMIKYVHASNVLNHISIMLKHGNKVLNHTRNIPATCKDR